MQKLSYVLLQSLKVILYSIRGPYRVKDCVKIWECFVPDDTEVCVGKPWDQSPLCLSSLWENNTVCRKISCCVCYHNKPVSVCHSEDAPQLMAHPVHFVSTLTETVPQPGCGSPRRQRSVSLFAPSNFEAMEANLRTFYTVPLSQLVEIL